MLTFNKKYFPNQKFIFALSGGVDSVAAALLLKKKNFNFIAVHINNKFIDQDDQTAKAVENFCDFYSIPYVVLNAKAKFKEGSKEDFCRTVRYSMLLKFAKQNNINYICTAHHLDDCVESYFMNFLKGHPEYTPIQYSCKYPDATIFRPFLLNKKSEFTSFAKKSGCIEFSLEDELNSDLSLMRNWTRQCVLPVIEKKYKGLHKVVFKKMKKHLDEVVKE